MLETFLHLIGLFGWCRNQKYTIQSMTMATQDFLTCPCFEISQTSLLYHKSLQMSACL